MSMIVRGLTVGALAIAMGASFAAPAHADPLIALACDDNDHHITVEVLNTEVVQVCYQ